MLSSNRHGLRQLMLYLIMLALVLTVGGQAAAAPAAPDPLTVAIYQAPDSLDPIESYMYPGGEITAHLYETLVTADSANQFVPTAGLAESWTLSADGLTWAFTIRSGALFHDGSAVTADAVVQNFRRWWDPDYPYYEEDAIYFGYLFGDPKGEDGALIVDVAATDGNKVEVNLSRPDSSLPAKLTMPTFAIASPQAIAAGTMDTMPVGSGPYRLAAFEPGTAVLLEAADDEARQAVKTAVFPNIRYEVYADVIAMYNGLVAGQVQAAGLPQSTLPAVAQTPGLRALAVPANNSAYLGINRAFEPLDKQEVRQAIAHAINKQAVLADAYGELDLVAKDLIPPDLWGADPDVQDYAFDPQKARDLLEQAGYGNGFAVTLSYRNVGRNYMSDPVAVAQAIADDLSAAGLDVTLQELPSGEFIDKVYAGELELFLLGWSLDYPHPQNMYGFVLCGNELGPRDDVLCDLLAQASDATTFAEELALIQQASRRAHDSAAVVPLAHGRSPLVIDNNLLGVQFAWNGANYSAASYADAHNYLPMTAGR